jgi:hypothetical protein
MRPLHGIVDVLNYALDEILPTSKLADMIEGGEELEFLHQPWQIYQDQAAPREKSHVLNTL